MSIKKAIQETLLIPYKNKYEKQCASYESAYDEYIRKSETDAKSRKTKSRLSCEIRSYRDGFDLSEIKSDLVIFLSEDSVLSAFAKKEICRSMEENPEIALLYGDEDYCEGEKSQYAGNVPASRRRFPFMKSVPAWDSFLAYFYIGGLFAVRTEALKGISYPKYETPVQNAYSFLLRAWHRIGEEGVFHYSGVLSHRFVKDINAVEESFEGADSSFDKMKADFFKEVGIHASLEQDEYGISHVVYEVEGSPLVSVLIPSKDNPEILKTCMDSLLQVNTYENIEILVIDNGSTQENREKISGYFKELEEKQRSSDSEAGKDGKSEALAQRFRYLYSPQEFNYSRLNNSLAKEARGEVLLLLNDDMEIKSPHALERMLGHVQNSKVGAVGAKLLYPDSTLIQHVGITNAVDGPIHKFIRNDDKNIYHHGRNRLVLDCLAVTGACLMTRKEVFEQLGGLNEELKVAYNDVDYGFKILDKGLYNVIRNDCILYHHESLSRGTDVLSQEKLERLKKEQKLLYSLHPSLYRSDPYEGALVKGGAELSFELESRFEHEKPKKEKPKVSDRDYHKYPGGIFVDFERLEKEEIARSCGEKYYVLQGFAVIPSIDNIRFTYKMVFEGTKGVTYEMPMKGYLRMNLEGRFPDTGHIRLAGFCNFVTESELPRDTYKIGVFAIDRVARRRLYQDTGRILVVDGE